MLNTVGKKESQARGVLHQTTQKPEIRKDRRKLKWAKSPGERVKKSKKTPRPGHPKAYRKIMR